MSETTPSLFSEAFRAELKEIVKEAVQASQNGHQRDQLISAEAAAKLWDIPKTWIEEKARRGKLPHVKLGIYTRFKLSDLEQFIRERRK